MNGDTGGDPDELDFEVGNSDKREVHWEELMLRLDTVVKYAQRMESFKTSALHHKADAKTEAERKCWALYYAEEKKFNRAKEQLLEIIDS